MSDESCGFDGPCAALAQRIGDGTAHLVAGHVHLGTLRMGGVCPFCRGNTSTAAVARWQWAHRVALTTTGPRPEEAA